MSLQSAKVISAVARERVEAARKVFKPGDPKLKEAICDILVEEAEKLRAVGYMKTVTDDLVPCLPAGHKDNDIAANARVLLARMQQQLFR
jgi:hypothetical protein